MSNFSSSELLTLTGVEALGLLKKREISSSELLHAYLSQIEKTKNLNLFITQTPEEARRNAQESDQRYAQGNPLPLDGLPFAHKDLFCTKDILTTAASEILSNFTPCYDATVVAKLKEAGVTMVGKTNADEFAMGSSTLTSHYGPSINPWICAQDQDPLVPGGSSGGSTAAVAAYAALASSGTDTGGSIRQPASYCGLVGIKPTYGRCSRYGIIAFASSLDQAGVHTRTVDDAALFLTHMAGHDPKDATSVKCDVPHYPDFLTGCLKGIRIGIPKEYHHAQLDTDISHLWEKGIEWVKSRGAQVEEVSLPHTALALPTYYIIAPAEASSNLARYDGVRFGVRHKGEHEDLNEMYEQTRGKGFGAEVRRRVLLGTYVLSSGFYDAYFKKAQRVRSLIAQDFTQVFSKGIDFLLTPTTPTPAFSIKTPPTDPLAMYFNDVFSTPSSLAGLPAISVPAGLSHKNLPLGLQLIGSPFSEGPLLNAAKALELEANFTPLPLQNVYIPA